MNHEDKGRSADILIDGTRIDLGEDILQTESSQKQSVEIKDRPNSDLDKAEVFLSEGLLSDAKKIAREFLKSNTCSAKAQKILDKIFDLELKQLLSGTKIPQINTEEKSIKEIQSAALHRLLDEFHMEEDFENKNKITNLFKTEKDYLKYKEDVFLLALTQPARSRIDIAIAFIELELFDIAKEILETVVRYDSYMVSGLYLLCLSLIYNKQEIEAVIKIEPFIRDLSIPDSEKIDFLYLMGLAFERLRDFKKSKEFYKRVHDISPKYRDVIEKLRN